MRKASVKPFLSGILIGAVVLLVVIFAAGWVVTSSSAHATAEQMAEKAVVDRLAGICVAQFQQDPAKTERVKVLKEKNSWERGRYVKEMGWATMPGDKSPGIGVPDACAQRIMDLEP